MKYKTTKLSKKDKYNSIKATKCKKIQKMY